MNTPFSTNNVRSMRSGTQKSYARGSRIYVKPLVWLILLPILAVTTSYADELPNFSALVDTEGAAVVKISVTTESEQNGFSGIPGLDLEQVPEQYRRYFEQWPFGQDRQQRRGAGFGSGFIIDADGYVITNAHVVDGAVDIRVGLNDRRELRASLVGADKSSDIAVLKVDADDLPVVKIGDSDNIKVGEWVLAIGSPFGFEHTATQGIVSALSRSLPDEAYVPFIQTDVAVNPGNSGGPLFNTDGEVIGVNSQIYSRSGGYQGLSFAIPINVAMSIAEQLRETGFATRGWLGVRIQNVDQSLAESFGLSKPEGALITEVTADSPADKAGFLPGDKRKTIKVTIEPLQSDVDNSRESVAKGQGSSSLGVTVAPVRSSELSSLGLDNGVRITAVDENGAAAKAGVIAGDIIVMFNRTKVESVKQLESLASDAPTGQSMPLLVQREDAPIFLAITLP